MADQDPWAQAAAEYKGGGGAPASAAPAQGADDYHIWDQDGGGQATQGGGPHFGSSLSDIVKTPIQHIGSMLSGPYHAFTDPATEQEQAAAPGAPLNGVMGHVAMGLKRMFVDPTTSELSQINGKNSREENFQHGMNAIPIIGPWAKNIEDETAQKGAVAGLEGLATDAFAPMGIAKIGGGLIKGGGMLARGLSASPESRALATTRAIVPGEPSQLLSRALKPSVNYPDFEQSTNSALPDVVKKVGGPSPGVSGFANAAKSAAKENNAGYQALKAPHLNEPMDLSPVGKAAQKSIPTIDRVMNPGLIPATDELADRFDPLHMASAQTKVPSTLGTADEMRVNAGQKLHGYYNLAGGDRFAAEGNPEVARIKAVGDSLRDLTYGKLSQLTGVPQDEIAAGQRQYGHLKDVSDVAGKRATVFGRQSPLSLQETLAATPGHPVSGAIDFIGQRMLKNATGSDALVNSALDRFKNPGGTPLQPANGIIPKIGMAAGSAAKAAGGRIGKIRVFGTGVNQRDQ